MPINQLQTNPHHVPWLLFLINPIVQHIGGFGLMFGQHIGIPHSSADICMTKLI
jgi:hypothetical protein